MSTTRRGDTGTPGNRGKFDRFVRTDGNVTDLATASRVAEVNRLLDDGKTLVGPIPQDNRDRIIDYAMHGGTADDWDIVSKHLIRPNTTVWNAVLDHTDYAVRTGRVSTLVDEGAEPFKRAEYATTSDWASVPTADQLLDGLRGVAAAERS
ncbi:hypothetical protein [Curtobacterium sp. MCSS17_016]|uniref:hypothetical protein n=1 Tax=Curtobacterium sp. MCSS17_016 TaxID=2175644 RepID=UPI000DA6F247|nr:hypothetical protein [Curtobacterium sp. MCSS17_016]WIE81496.1 hypothetical protein DEJ19_019865 [Curtobacterium sp. MCSS17_016]